LALLNTLNFEEEELKMKKLGIILAAVVVLFGFGASAFAMEMYEPEARAAKLAEEKASVVVISGEMTFGMMTEFDAATSTLGFANMYADVTLWPDEYNSVLFEIAGDNLFSAGNAPTIPYFFLTTRLGQYFDLPVAVDLTMGITNLNSRKYEVTDHAYERNLVRRLGSRIPLKLKVAADMVEFSIGMGYGQGSEDLNDFAFVLLIPEIGPASFEVFYVAKDNADLEGDLGFDFKATDLVGGMLGLAGGFVYSIPGGTAGGRSIDLDGDGVTDVTIAAGDWAWGFGIEIIYAPVEFGVSMNGWDGFEFALVGIDIDVAVLDYLGLYFATALGLDDAVYAETFRGFEATVYVKPGASKWAIGYLYQEEVDDYGGIHPAVATGFTGQGGFFINCDIDF
jgi:hypothetical protein